MGSFPTNQFSRQNREMIDLPNSLVPVAQRDCLHKRGQQLYLPNAPHNYDGRENRNQRIIERGHELRDNK